MQELLEKLTDWKPTQPGTNVLQMDLNPTGATVAIAAQKQDSLSCLVGEMTVSSPVGPAGSGVPLSERASAMADRLTGLMENIRVIEVDAGAEVAVLRSSAPAVRGDAKHYYEVKVTPTVANLKRYRTESGSNSRESIGYALTHEVLAKVADDLI